MISTKVAISSTGKDLDSKVDAVFGRCSYFIVAEIKDKKIVNFEAMKNENTERLSGAGVCTAQSVAEKNVSLVITGNIGPRALNILNQFNIKIHKDSGIIKEVLEKLIKNGII